MTIADEFGQSSGRQRISFCSTPARIKFSPLAPLSFKNQKHGTTSPPQTVTLTNQGKATLFITSIKATGEFGATSTCGRSVACQSQLHHQRHVFSEERGSLLGHCPDQRQRFLQTAGHRS